MSVLGRRVVLCVRCRWATWFLFTCVPARCVVLRGCVACAVSWATWLLFTGVPARCVVSCVRCSGRLGPFPVHRCARLVRCVACAVSFVFFFFGNTSPKSMATRQWLGVSPIYKEDTVIPLIYGQGMDICRVQLRI